MSYAHWDYWELYHKVTFSPLDRLVIVNVGEGVINVKRDIFSAAKEWLKTYGYSKWKMPIRSTGGDNIPGDVVQTVGDLYFMTNGWRVWFDHSVAFDGVLYSDNYSTPFVVPDGTFIGQATVSALVNNPKAVTVTVSEEIGEVDIGSVKGVAVTGVSDFQADTSTIFDQVMTDHQIDGTYGVEFIRSSYSGCIVIDPDADAPDPDMLIGLANNPANTWDGAKDVGDTVYIYKYHVHNDLDIPIDSNIRNAYFESHSPVDSSITVGAGTATKNANFYRITLSGELDGAVHVHGAAMEEVTNFEGIIHDSSLKGDISLRPGSAKKISIHNCRTSGSTDNPVNLTVAGAEFCIKGYNGAFNLIGKDVDDKSCVGLQGGVATIASSCVAGEIILTGYGGYVDNSGVGCTVNTDNFLDADNISTAVRAELTTELNGILYMVKTLKNKRSLQKQGDVWQIIVFDDDEVNPILVKDLKDAYGNNISDLAAGTLAVELASSV